MKLLNVSVCSQGCIFNLLMLQIAYHSIFGSELSQLQLDIDFSKLEIGIPQIAPSAVSSPFEQGRSAGEFTRPSSLSPTKSVNYWSKARKLAKEREGR